MSILNNIDSWGGNSSCITVVNNPNKRTYIEGERLSLNGMQVKYFTSNKVPELIENYVTYPSKDSVLSREDNTVIVQYTSLDGDIFKTALSINVKYPVRIEVIYLPKSAYKRNDVVDITGIIAEVVYNDDSRERISESQLTTTPAIGSPVEDNKVIVFSYNHNDIEYKYYYELDNSKLGFDESVVTTFASDTWEQIKQMIEASKLGKFDMQDYWKVGDTRSVSAQGGGIFGAELVILGFNSKMDDYGNINHVIIGNKNISIFGQYCNYNKDDGYNFEPSCDMYNNETYNTFIAKINTYELFKIIILNNISDGEGTKVGYMSKTKESKINKKIRVLKKEDVIGDTAFEYYKIASNRIKYSTNNVAVPYALNNFYTSSITVRDAGGGHVRYFMHGILFDVINAQGEYELKGYGSAIGVNTRDIGFAYYFAIG